jgi:hypothetical protein
MKISPTPTYFSAPSPELLGRWGGNYILREHYNA